MYAFIIFVIGRIRLARRFVLHDSWRETFFLEKVFHAKNREERNICQTFPSLLYIRKFMQIPIFKLIKSL